jgi:hypothetical protein
MAPHSNSKHSKKFTNNVVGEQGQDLFHGDLLPTSTTAVATGGDAAAAGGGGSSSSSAIDVSTRVSPPLFSAEAEEAAYDEEDERETCGRDEHTRYVAVVMDPTALLLADSTDPTDPKEPKEPTDASHPTNTMDMSNRSAPYSTQKEQNGRKEQKEQKERQAQKEQALVRRFDTSQRLSKHAHLLCECLLARRQPNVLVS